VQYDYERFTPDRFQEFCQALLVREFRGVQCYPVGQKDGGRDALAGPSKDTTVFQVKFKRDRLKNDDGYKILKAAIDAELPKIRKLVERGATSYVLMTNLAGTSALDVGTMDKMQEYLGKHVSIPAQVWWRVDLDARLHNAYDLKWVFSEILTSADMLRDLIDEGLGENSRRRMLAITGYITAQYDADEYVKFRQADLQASDLLALFVDVPVSPHLAMKQGRDRGQNVARAFRAVVEDQADGSTDVVRGRLRVGGATLLSHTASQAELRRVVLEGAPGQGKSTLAQYLCQVQRMKFLGKEARLATVPANHRLVPARVPFKVDLRDLASWLRRVDPITERALPDDLPLSLESFLSAQVTHSSGGQSFAVDDLTMFLQRVPGLVLLDGLDEVATSSDRRLVIDAVSAASSRLFELSPMTQLVVTSRPAAVVNAPMFDAKSWDYLHLEDITEALIFDYTERWSAARNIDRRDIDEIKQILRAKLSSAHVKDLARNAMQLTILLNLIQARGQALPDQRTELYDQYIDVFFNREAEKNRVVLENRQLLIDLHGFLAWRMHSSSESKRGNGRITQEALRELLAEYLELHEYDDGVLDDLLAGVVQRIVALVSRVEGTFEFEVQPLREYFTARHLYNTAPYSPAGRPASGTKPEIFGAIAPNPYWLNVTRFFAGCYSVGELAGLADQVDDLLSDSLWGKSSFVRTVATSMLTDRVFHQAPKVTRRVIASSVDDLTLRYAFQRQFSVNHAPQLDLSLDSGLAEACALSLARSLHLPILAARREAGYIFAGLGPEGLRAEIWLKARPEPNDSELVTRWLEVGVQSGLVKFLDESDSAGLSKIPDYWRLLAEGGHESLYSSADEERRVLAAGMDERFHLTQPVAVPGPTKLLFLPFRYEHLLRGDKSNLFNGGPQNKVAGEILGPLNARIQRLISAGRPEFASARSPWDELLDLIESDCGRTWLSWRLAASVVSAGIEGEGVEANVGFECGSAISLALSAKENRSNPQWWTKLATKASSGLERRVWLLFYSKLANPVSLSVCRAQCDEFVESLDPAQFDALLDSLQRNRGVTIPESRWNALERGGMSYRSQVLLAVRCNNRVQRTLSKTVPDTVLERDPAIANLLLRWFVEIDSGGLDEKGWAEYARVCKRLYAWSSDPFIGSFEVQFDGSAPLPRDLAESIFDDCYSYPTSLVGLADRTVSSARQRSLTPIGKVARKAKWESA
jgi:hypothetical protein